MRNLTEENLTEAVLAQISNTCQPRLRQIMVSLVKNLHNFIREIEPTEEEWMLGIQFLTNVGQMCDDKRQEFILLSDTLGVTALKDSINNRKVEGATEATVLGPFYRAGAEIQPYMYDMSDGHKGEPIVVTGKVTDPQGNPIPGALLDIWQASAEGQYDLQMPELENEMSLRCKLLTDEAGHYGFRSIKPSSYPIPYDGPVGNMLKALGRHPYRPAHIHFIISAEGYEPVTTHIFVEGDPYLDSDVVFGVKDSLIADFVRIDSPEEAAKYEVKAPFYKVEYNFGLQPSGTGRD